MPLFAGAADWPNFRGPNYDGISTETGLTTQWSGEIPKLWDRKIGDAFSSFACVDGQLYTCGTKNDHQVLLCLKADSGETIWEVPFEKQYKERQGGDGTRATPTVDDGRVYIFGAVGKLACYDAKDGEEVWRTSYTKDPTWGYSGSVLVDGDLAIVSPGGPNGSLAAHDKKTGKLVWKSGSDPAGYATPYPFSFEGKRYIAGFTGTSAMIAEASSGREVWRMPWKTDYDVNAAAPIFHEGHLFFSSGYRHGCILLKLRAEGDYLKAD
jgi:outer membrane protein assembly factor BamB